MKKIFKKTLKFLFDITLMAIMLVSAQHVMNLPLGWTSFGYVVIFGVVLTVYTYKQGEVYYKEGIKTGMEIQRVSDVIFVYADDGKDEFTIIAPNEVIFSPQIKFLMNNTIESHDNNYRYKMASMINHDTKTEVTFTKIKD